MTSKVLSTISLFVALLALVKSTLDYRHASRLPILKLIQERFGSWRAKEVWLGLLVGSFSVLAPAGLAASLGWLQFDRAGSLTGQVMLLGLLTLVVKFGWAAAEELIYRGALLPQAARKQSRSTARWMPSCLRNRDRCNA